MSEDEKNNADEKINNAPEISYDNASDDLRNNDREFLQEPFAEQPLEPQVTANKKPPVPAKYQENAVEKNVLLFLSEELESLRKAKKVDSYNLETEYGKTRKNILWSVWIMLFFTFAVVGLFTYFSVKKVTADERTVEVDFDSFEDMNLRNLFDALSRTQELYESASRRHAELQGALAAQLSHAQQNLDAELEMMKKMRLSRKAAKQRRDALQAEYDESVKLAHSQYDAQIASAEVEVRQYEKQLKSYDSENVARAQEWEKRMDSERQVYELERRRTVENYEKQVNRLKDELDESRRKSIEDRRQTVNEVSARYESELALYDPVIKDERFNRIIGENDSGKNGSPVFQSLSAGGAYSENFKAAMERISRQKEDFKYLDSFSEKIPYHNDMQSAVHARQDILDKITDTFASAAEEEIRQADMRTARVKVQLDVSEKEKNMYINNYEGLARILNSGSIDADADGYVIDAGNSAGPAIFLKDRVRAGVKNNGSTVAVVLNEAGEEVVSGALWFKGKMFFFSPDDDSINIKDGWTIKLSARPEQVPEIPKVPDGRTENPDIREEQSASETVIPEPSAPASDTAYDNADGNNVIFIEENAEESPVGD